MKKNPNEQNEVNNPSYKVHISPLAGEALIAYLQSKGHSLRFTEPVSAVAEPIALHPDVIMCKLGVSDSAPIFCGEPSLLGAAYPADVRYNACCTGKYFIHNLKYTDGRLLQAACGFSLHGLGNPQTAALRHSRSAAASAAGGKAACQGFVERSTSALFSLPVHVAQGYTKCSTVCVDEDSIISYDDGIAKACLKAGLEVLHISSGHILLPGYSEGFIGGCSGRIGNEIIFNGDLSAHPDFTAIRDFIESRGLSCKWFCEYPLTDIGSVISVRYGL